MTKEKTLTLYQTFIIAVLAFLQFTIILDFMVLSPLGAQLLRELSIDTRQFGLVVSAYAFAAGLAGLLAAGFADRFDRKRLLLFFYTGFIVGTFLCGIAPNYTFLLLARIFTGIFGGVIGSIIFAIITDLFEWQVRGRVMGFVQMAFATSQVFGLPLGLYMANHWGWHAPFLLIATVSALAMGLIVWKMRPVKAHLEVQSGHSAFEHLRQTVSQKRYLRGFATTALLSTGGFMLMPFGSAFAVHNLGVTLDQLPLVYMITGLCSLAAGPLIGKYSDKVGKYPVFIAGSVLGTVLVIIYTNLGVTPLWILITLNSVLMIGITSRMISSSALMTAVPDLPDRGAFMGVNSSLAQISGGFASVLAGMIIFQTPGGKLEHYPTLGYVVVITMAVTVWMMYYLNRYVQARHHSLTHPVSAAPVAEAVVQAPAEI